MKMAVQRLLWFGWMRRNSALPPVRLRQFMMVPIPDQLLGGGWIARAPLVGNIDQDQ
jgi:hypothetical protein